MLEDHPDNDGVAEAIAKAAQEAEVDRIAEGGGREGRHAGKYQHELQDIPRISYSSSRGNL